jgi:hypothetical protein
MTAPLRTVKTRGIQINPDINWYKYRSCLTCPTVISNQVKRICARFGLYFTRFTNFLLKNGLIYLKNQKKDAETIISECFETRKLKYLQDIEFNYYKDQLGDDFFTVGNELVAQGATFNGYTSLCLMYGLIWLREAGIEDFFLNLDFITFLNLRSRLRNERGHIDTERIKDASIDLSTIGLFE